MAELSLLEMDPFLQYSPSMVAAAAYCLASYTINTSLWVSLIFYLVNLILLKFLKKLGKKCDF